MRWPRQHLEPACIDFRVALAAGAHATDLSESYPKEVGLPGTESESVKVRTKWVGVWVGCSRFILALLCESSGNQRVSDRPPGRHTGGQCRWTAIVLHCAGWQAPPICSQIRAVPAINATAVLAISRVRLTTRDVSAPSISARDAFGLNRQRIRRAGLNVSSSGFG